MPRVGWVAVSSRSPRAYCRRQCSLHYISTAPSWSRPRWRCLFATSVPAVSPQPVPVASLRGLAVSLACRRDTGVGRETSSETETGKMAAEGAQSFEKENIWTIPNVLSLSRIILSPVLGYQVLLGNYLAAFGLLTVAAVSDMVDGQIARSYPGQSSMLGSVLDPLADKFLISILCITLTLQSLIPLPLTVVILSRDALLIGASFYLRYSTLPPPRTWARYWDIQRSTLQVTPSPLSKINTLLQLSTVGLSLGAALINASHHPLLQALWVITAVSTVMSGASYIIQLKGFKILRKTRR